jgi:cytochrome c
MASGFATVDATCFSCHSPDAGPAQRIAPPMAAIKRRYQRSARDYAGFRDALISFVNDPSPQNALMRNAVQRFGVMPKMAFDTAVLEDVAYYLYHSEIEEPAWFSRHYAQERARYTAAASAQRTTAEDYRRYGQQLAMQTKTELGSNMKRSLKEGGVDATVDFCRLRAAPIARQMSATLGASIKRVSDRPRNPANTANARELEVIAAFRDAMARGESMTSAVDEFDDRMVGYYPVVTNGMCLQCHGRVGEDIAPSTHERIMAAYPTDQATGYGSNELRGIFVVSMDKGAESGDIPD